MVDNFNTFLEKISNASGENSLCEAIRSGYRVLTENSDDSWPAVPGWKYVWLSMNRSYYMRGDFKVWFYNANANNGDEDYVLSVGGVNYKGILLDTSNIKGMDRYISPKRISKSDIPVILAKVNKFIDETSVLNIIRNAYIRHEVRKVDDDYGIMTCLYKYATYAHIDGIGTVDDAIEYETMYANGVYDELKDVFNEFFHIYNVADLADIGITDLTADVDMEAVYLYKAKRLGYHLRDMDRVLGAYMLYGGDRYITDAEKAEILDSIFDRMAAEVKLDPVSYADDDKCLFQDYAKALVNGEEA